MALTHYSAAPLLDSPRMQRYGFPEYQQQTSPAAGADFSIAMDGRYFTRLITVFCRLVTDANVAAREVVVEYQSPEGNRFALSGAPVTVSAGSTNDYAFSVFQDQADWPSDSTILAPLQPIMLPGSFIVKVHIVNVQVGDQLSRIRTFWERFYSDSPIPGADPSTF